MLWARQTNLAYESTLLQLHVPLKAAPTIGHKKIRHSPPPPGGGKGDLGRGKGDTDEESGRSSTTFPRLSVSTHSRLGVGVQHWQLLAGMAYSVDEGGRRRRRAETRGGHRGAKKYVARTLSLDSHPAWRMRCVRKRHFMGRRVLVYTRWR